MKTAPPCNEARAAPETARPTPHSSSLKVAVLFLQPRCNMHCTFCVTEDNFSAMTFDQGVALLNRLRDLGVRTVVLGGGEPFDWPHDVIALTREAKARGFTVQIGTNGIALPEGFERVESIDRWVLPLESVDPEPHNRMRLYRDRHHGIVTGRMAALGAAGRSITLSTVVTAVNRDDVLAVGRFLRTYHSRYGNVHAWHLYRFLPVGRGGAVNAASLTIPPEEYERLYREACSLDCGFRLYRRVDMYHSRTVDFFWYEGDRIVRGAEAWDPAQHGVAAAGEADRRGDREAPALDSKTDAAIARSRRQAGGVSSCPTRPSLDPSLLDAMACEAA